MLLAYTLIGAVLTIVGNLVADIALTVADPESGWHDRPGDNREDGSHVTDRCRFPPAA